MKKTGLISLLLCFFMIVQCCAFSASAEGAIDASITFGCNTIDAKMPLLGGEQLIENARSVVLFEANTQTLMHIWNADEPMYPASLVKIMTALIAFEECDLTEMVMVSEEALSTIEYNAFSADLEAGEVISLQDLLYCMLVASANDAAAAIADHIAGSQEAFVEKMNQYAVELGCTNTNFTDAHGLDGTQYASARDISRILAEALKHEQFLEIFGTIYYEVPATNKSSSRTLKSINYILNDDDNAYYYDSRVVGSRTGVAEDGERCIASVAEENSMQLICVVMGSKSVYQDDGYYIDVFGGYYETSELLDKGFDGFDTAQLFYPNQAYLQCSVENGDCDVVVGPQISASSVLPAGFTQTNLSYQYTDVLNAFKAPIEKGAKQSSVQVWYGNICVAQADLYAMNRVELQQLNPGNANDNKNDTSILNAVLRIGAIVVGILLILVLFARLSSKLRFAAVRKRSRQRRQSRRRSY